MHIEDNQASVVVNGHTEETTLGQQPSVIIRRSTLISLLSPTPGLVQMHRMYLQFFNLQEMQRAKDFAVGKFSRLG